MPTKAETAYPRLKNYVTSRELTEIYTPTQEELTLANQYTKKGATKLGFLVLLKTFQRLGYFVDSNIVPSAIVSHIIKCTQLSVLPSCLTSYEQSKTRKRHIALIREFQSVTSYGAKARRVVIRSMGQAARTKNDLADIINVAIEELVHHRYELPVFNTLVKAAKRVRGTIDRAFYRQVRQSLNHEDEKQLDSFVAHVKGWLLDITQKTDHSFPDNQSVRLEQGRPVLKRPKKKVDFKKLAQIESLIAERIKPVNLLDILTDTELWLNWTQYFRLLSGPDSKIEDSVSRYLAATFCYGCNLGSSQTANSLSNFDRQQIAYVNQRHIGLPSLEKAIYRIINAYNRFSLPKFWGSGKKVSADGTKWDIYEQNLLAEYHIRYGGYGGIGYYHVSDTYIALFSHFIPCGVWEAVYILDGLLKNTSDIQPDTIHIALNSGISINCFDRVSDSAYTTTTAHIGNF